MFIFSLEIFLLLYFLIKQKIGDKYKLVFTINWKLKNWTSTSFYKHYQQLFINLAPWNCYSCNPFPNTGYQKPNWLLTCDTFVISDICTMNGRTYTQGQQWYDGCDRICRCEDGSTGFYRCQDRSVVPTITSSF